MAGERDRVEGVRKFTAPAIANGRVFVPSMRFAAFGLLGKAGEEK
jgi:hypothetical protein